MRLKKYEEQQNAIGKGDGAVPEKPNQ
jgi:hypothetical protein